MTMHIAIFIALLTAFCALVWALTNYPEETLALIFVVSLVVFLWFGAGHLAEVFA